MKRQRKAVMSVVEIGYAAMTTDAVRPSGSFTVLDDVQHVSKRDKCTSRI